MDDYEERINLEIRLFKLPINEMKKLLKKFNLKLKKATKMELKKSYEREKEALKKAEQFGIHTKPSKSSTSTKKLKSHESFGCDETHLLLDNVDHKIIEEELKKLGV